MYYAGPLALPLGGGRARSLYATPPSPPPPNFTALLPEQARRPTFIQRRPASCCVIDLSIAEAPRDLKHCHCFTVWH